MKILELFSGTGSIGKAFPNDEVISVDIDPHFNPTHTVSIFDFDYKQYDGFCYIHASPPCQYFSIMLKSWYGRKKRVNGEMVIFTKEIHESLVVEISDKLVLKALEIIEYFKPKFYTIENPYSSYYLSLINRPYMTPYKHIVINYCMYDHPVKKPTVIFNNFDLEGKLCDKSHEHLKWGEFNGNAKRLYERYRIPHKLCESIATHIQCKGGCGGCEGCNR